MPKRIQLRRTKGWRKPAGAVVVSRPSRWGNPYNQTHQRSREQCVELYRAMLLHPHSSEFLAEVRRELRGKDLACWCPLGSPCHADVLLELANPEVKRA